MSADVHLLGSTAALSVVHAMLRCTFNHAVRVWMGKLGRIGDFSRSLFVEALAFGFTAPAGSFSLHLDGRLTAAAILIAGAAGHMTGQFTHRSSFFLKRICGKTGFYCLFPILFCSSPRIFIPPSRFFSDYCHIIDKK